MAVAAILKITKIAISPQRFDRSLRNLARLCKIGLLTVLAVKKIEFSNSKMADSRHFEKKPLNRHISATVWPILMKFGMAKLICPIQGTGSYNFECFEN